eukprot:356884-Chlamydomonas_euryale.AAC.1
MVLAPQEVSVAAQLSQQHMQTGRGGQPHSGASVAESPESSPVPSRLLFLTPVKASADGAGGGGGPWHSWRELGDSGEAYGAPSAAARASCDNRVCDAAVAVQSPCAAADTPGVMSGGDTPQLQASRRGRAAAAAAAAVAAADAAAAAAMMRRGGADASLPGLSCGDAVSLHISLLAELRERRERRAARTARASAAAAMLQPCSGLGDRGGVPAAAAAAALLAAAAAPRSAGSSPVPPAAMAAKVRSDGGAVGRPQLTLPEGPSFAALRAGGWGNGGSSGASTTSTPGMSTASAASLHPGSASSSAAAAAAPSPPPPPA